MAARVCSAVLLFIAVTGCAVGVKHDYGTIAPLFTASGGSPMALAVHDQRAPVLSGKRETDWVGVSRGGYNNPFKVTTVSGKPLADDFGATIARALQARGFTVTTIAAIPTAAPANVVSALVTTGQARLLAVTLKTWQCDVVLVTKLEYSVDASVYGPDGKLTATKTINYSGALGSALDSRDLIPRWYKLALETLFNDEKIVAALRS